MKITSSAFKDGEFIPAKYTCDGGDHRFPFEISDLPSGTQSLALTLNDPDAPSGDFIHWLHWNIPTTSTSFSEDSPVLGVDGYNSSGKVGYRGPCPPSEHRYYLRVYAIDSVLDLKETASKKELLDAMNGHILDEGVLMGKYKRQ